jgi:hypothetical protein
MPGHLNRLQGQRIASGPVRQLGMPEHLGGYQWRDPRRVSPGRLAELQAHDRKIASARPVSVPDLHRAAAMSRMAEFGRLRASGIGVDTAGARVGVSTTTAWKYEHVRKENDGQA